MCTRCVRFTREVSGQSELYVDGRGHREEIDIFPGKPLDNKLSGNVVDLWPVGALLDKDFLFKQRVWLLKQAPSISPADSGGENIYIEYNEGVIYRIKPRFNPEVNQWWISDDTRYSFKPVHNEGRLKQARRSQYGSQIETAYAKASEAAEMGLRAAAKEGVASIYAVMSPMMSCEEAWLLGKYVRSIDPAAMLILGPVPTSGQDEIFKHYLTGKETFRIKAEKVPNAAGIRRVLRMLGGASAIFEEFVVGTRAEFKNLKAGWIVGGYLSNWIPANQPAQLKRSFRVVQDILPTSLSEAAEVVLPAAAWAEKDGCWENYAGKIQAFSAAVRPVEGARRDGDVYLSLLGRKGMFNAEQIRTEMAGPFASVKGPGVREEERRVGVVGLERNMRCGN